MLFVRMLQDGYVAVNYSGQTTFTSGEAHELLFRFLEADVEPATKWLIKYFNSVMDPKSLAILEGTPNASALSKAKTAMEAVHPFFRYNDYFSIISEMLAYHLNFCLLQPSHTETQYSMEWYGERLKPLVGNFLIDSTQIHRHADDNQIYLNLPNPSLVYDVFEKAFYEKYVAARKSGDIAQTGIHGVKYASYLQNEVSHRIYWLLDASARYFSKLSADQRAHLYRNIFPSKYGQADLKIVKHISFADPQRAKTNPLSVIAARNTEFIQAAEEGTLEEYMREYERKKDRQALDASAREIFALIRDNTVGLEPDLQRELNQAIEAAIADNEQAFFEEYEVDNLNQLLFLELEQLIKNGSIVKRCRLCEHYFITTNKNIDYCNNIAEGETQPCSEIGSTRAFLKKLDEDHPLQIYNRAYKTHYARKKNGLMTEEQFDDWRDEARVMLDAVRAGESDADEFEKWLKK